VFPQKKTRENHSLKRTIEVITQVIITNKKIMRLILEGAKGKKQPKYLVLVF
jgi:hypothetical protein